MFDVSIVPAPLCFLLCWGFINSYIELFAHKIYARRVIHMPFPFTLNWNEVLYSEKKCRPLDRNQVMWMHGYIYICMNRCRTNANLYQSRMGWCYGLYIVEQTPWWCWFVPLVLVVSVSQCEINVLIWFQCHFGEERPIGTPTRVSYLSIRICLNHVQCFSSVEL